jgi:hypothetical protein
LFGDSPVTVSEQYRYLGIVFHSRTGISSAPTHLLAAGERALHSLYRRCAEHQIDTPSIMCQLFDSLITPVLSYACETWSLAPGTVTTLNDFEILHRRFMKRIAGMHHTTLNPAVYAEFGRSPLSHHWLRLSSNFLTRLASLPDDRLAKHALLEALHLESTGHPTGVGSLQQRLSSLGLATTTTDELAALTPATVRQAIQSNWANEWQQQMVRGSETSQRAHYLSILPEFPTTCQPYLSDPSIPHTHRCTISRFRCGNHWLTAHTSRYARTVEDRRHHNSACPVCATHTWSEGNDMLLCDSCDSAWHCQCLNLSCLPSGLWYCPTCTSQNRCSPIARLAHDERRSKSTHCPHCPSPIEDAHHFLFHCPFYEPIRTHYSNLFPPEITSVCAWLSQPAPRISEFLFRCFKQHRQNIHSPMSPAGSVDSKLIE